MNPAPTRQDDETLLLWLKWRDMGYTTGQIADHVGGRSSRVRTATNRVLETVAPS